MAINTIVRAGRGKWLLGVYLLALMLPATLSAGSKGGIKGIDIIVKRQPSGHAFVVRTDGNGGFSMLVPEAGEYMLAVQSGAAVNNLKVGTAVRLTMDVRRDVRDSALPSRARRATAMALVKSPLVGRNLPRLGKSLDLTERMQVDGPTVVSGRIEVDQVITSVEHVTFTAVTGGPAPLDRTFEIVAEGVDGYSYKMRSNVKDNDRLPVRVQLDPAAGLVASGGANPVIRIRPPNTGLAVGVYQGLVEVEITPADGSPVILQQIGVTYDIRRSGDIGLVSDRRDYVLPALPPATRDGVPRLTIMTLLLTNPDSTEQTFTMGYEKPGDQAIFRFPQPTFRIAAGGTVRVPVEVNRDAFLAKKGGRECVTVTKTNADKTTSTYTYYYLPPDTTGGTLRPQGFVACTPSRLRPVLVRAPSQLTLGIPAEYEIEAIDDCGNPVTGFIARLALGGGGPQEARKAITKGGQQGFLVVMPDPDQPGSETEVVIEVSNGALYGITRTQAGLRRNVPAAPVVRGTVKNSVGNVRGIAVSPGDLIDISVDLPGTSERTADPGAPLPLELGGVQVLIDGERIEVSSVSSTQVIARQTPKKDFGDRVASLAVSKDGMISAPVPLHVVDYTPQLLAARKKLQDGSLVPLSPTSRVAAGDTIVLYATGLGDVEGAPGFAVKQPVSGLIGGDKLKKMSAVYRICAGCLAPEVIAGRPLDEIYVIEAEVPKDMLSHDLASGEVPITIEVGDVVSAALKGYGDASLLTTARFITSVPVPYFYNGGAASIDDVLRSESVGSNHSFQAPFRMDFGASRFDRFGWGTTDPTGENPPPVVSSDQYSLRVQSLPVGTNPIYYGHYWMTHRLTTVLSPAACGGTIAKNPPSNDAFYLEQMDVQLAVTPAPGWTLSHWIGADPSGSVYMNAPHTVTGVCVQATGLTLTTNLGTKPGLSVWFSSAKGAFNSATGSVTGSAAAPTSLNVPQGYLDGGVYRIFSKTSTPVLTWNGPVGNGYYAQLANPPALPTTYTANYSAACVVVNPGVSPASAGNLNISGTLYTQNGAPARCFAIGSTVTITAVPNAGQCLLNWGPWPAITSSANPLQIVIGAGTVANPVAYLGPCIAVCLPPLAGTVGRYHFEEAASVTALADDSTAPAAPLAAIQTLLRGTGKVGGAVYFDSTPKANLFLGTVTGSAATTGSSPAKYNFGTGAFSLDFWIKLDGTLASGRPILQKLDGSASNELPPRPAFGFRLRTVAGERLQLTLASNGVTATYTGTLPLPINQWVHVAVSVPRPGTPVFYLNGTADTPAAVGSVAGTLNNNAPLLVGNIAGPGTLAGPSAAAVSTRFWLDELGLFNTALAKTDIDKLVAADRAGTCPGAAQCTIAPAGMVAWWGYSPATSATVTDLTGNGHDGAIVGGRLASSHVGPAYGVSTSSYMDAPHKAGLNMNQGPFSIRLWVKWPANTSPGPNPVMVTKMATAAGLDKGYSFALAPDQTGVGGAWTSGLDLLINDVSGINYLWYTGVGGAFAKNTIAADGQWHLVGFSYRPATGSVAPKVQFYVDGVAVATAANGQAQGAFTPLDFDNTAAVRVGANGTSPTSLKFQGELDEIQIFKKELSAAEMKAIFDAGTAGQCALAPAVTLTLETNPAGLDGRIGATGAFATAPISQSVPANSMQTIGVTDKQVKNSIGYGFVNWTSTGAAIATQQATTTIQPALSAIATANFQEVCYLVTTSVAGGTGGTVALSPVSGGLTGYPANCYPQGIQLRVTAAAIVDYGLRTVVISIGGVPQTVTDPITFINVTGPVNITATFAPRPNPILSATQPVLQSGSSYTTTISFTNSTASAGTNLRIANLTITQAGVTLTTPLPIVYGNLPANGSGGSMVVTYSIPASVLAGTTFFINLTVEVTNVNGDVFISNPSFSQTKP